MINVLQHNVVATWFGRLFILLAALLLTVSAASAGTIHVIPRLDAQSLVPLIQPLLGEDGYVNSYEGRLVISADDQTFARIQALLAKLPDQPRTVTVHLRRAAGRTTHAGGVYLNRSGIVVGAGTSRHLEHSTYTIKTLAGHGAHIGQGSLVTLADGYYPVLARLQQGIWVVPEVTADGRVRLTIRQRHEQLQGPGRIATQGLSTTLLLTPGQWYPLGRINVRGHTGSVGLGGAAVHGKTVTLPLQVKVELN